MGYTTDLAFTDAFLRDVLTAAQANPDPSSWSPITSGPPSAQDAMLLAADGLQRLHFDENGAVTGGGLSQEPSPSGALTSGTASPPVLTLDTGAGAGAVPALPLETGTGAAPGIPVGGLPSGGGSPTLPSGGAPRGVYTSDAGAGAAPGIPVGGLPSAGAVRALPLGTGAGAGAAPGIPVAGLPSEGGSPTPPSGGAPGGVYTSDAGAGAAPGIPVGGLLSGGGSPAPPSGGAPGGVSGLHIDDQGDATPSPLEGFGSPIDLGIPGANISDHGASGSGWLLDI